MKHLDNYTFIHSLYGLTQISIEESILKNDIVVRVSYFCDILNYYRREVKENYELRVRNIIYRKNKEDLENYVSDIERFKKYPEELSEELIEAKKEEFNVDKSKMSLSSYKSTFIESHTINQLTKSEKLKPYIQYLINKEVIADEESAVHYWNKFIKDPY